MKKEMIKKGANLCRCATDEGANLLSHEPGMRCQLGCREWLAGGANLGVVERWREVPTWLSLGIGGRCQLFVVRVPTPMSPHRPGYALPLTPEVWYFVSPGCSAAPEGRANPGN